MGIVLKRADEIPRENRYVKILLYGRPGTGKTWSACRGEGVAVCLMEPIGLESIIESNPKALVHEAKTLDDVYGFMKMILNGEFKKMGIKTVVFDSLRELQRMKKAEMQGKTTSFTLEQWGILTEFMRRLFRKIRDWPINVVAITTEDGEMESSTGIRWAQPNFEGRQLGPEIVEFFNVAARCYKGAKGRFRITATTPDNFVTKSCGPIKGILENDVGKWIEKLTEKDTKEEPKEEKEENGKD